MPVPTMTRKEANGWIAYSGWSVAAIAAVSILGWPETTPNWRWAAIIPPFITAALITAIMYGSTPKTQREDEMG